MFKKMLFSKSLRWSVVFLAILIAFATGMNTHPSETHASCRPFEIIQTGIPLIDPLVKIEKIDTVDQLRQLELQLIRLDLNEYEHLSTTTKDLIAGSILEACRKYDLPPALMHAIFQIESDYRFNIDHPIVITKIKGKPVKTNARGLGGIMWTYWSEELKAEGIAETSSDMYMPRNNILATGYILRTIIDSELKKDRNGWIVGRIISRYYGSTSPAYEAKMREVTSNLWLKRIAREIGTASVIPDSTQRSE